MAEVLLFHHVQGLTPGVLAFADELRVAGHTVHTPDLFGEGLTFPAIEDGMAHLRQVGFREIAGRAARFAEDLPTGLVYAGMSMGVGGAQQLAQTRAGTRAAVFLHGCLPASEFGSWPAGVPVQVHAMDADPFFVEEGGDIDAARALVAEAEYAELFLYPGGDHLFTDNSLPEYDAAATRLVLERMLKLLDTV